MAHGRSAIGGVSVEWLKDWGSEEWSTFGAVISAVIAFAALGYAWKTNRASEQRQGEMAALAARSASAAEGSMEAARRSAVASEDSAEAAKRALNIQEAEHFHSKKANLQILRAVTSIRRDIEGVVVMGGPPAFHFTLKNIGGSEAFDIVPSIKSDFGMTTPKRHKKNIPPMEEAPFGGSIERAKALRAPKPSMVTFRLSYHDASGRHDLDAVFSLTFELGKEHPADIVSVMLDGEPHHQHPDTVVH